MINTYYTLRRETDTCTVDYPVRCRTMAEAEAYAAEMRRYCLGGEFRIVIHQESRRPAFRF